MANDIFRERVTLRGVRRRDAHRCALAELREEMLAAGDALAHALTHAAAAAELASAAPTAARPPERGGRDRRRSEALDTEHSPDHLAEIGAAIDPRARRHDGVARAAAAAGGTSSAASARPARWPPKPARRRERLARAAGRRSRHRGRSSEHGSSSPPRSTTRTAIHTSATRTRRSAPTRSRAIGACAVTTCTSSSAWTSTGRRSRRPRRAQGIAPQAARR